jgi:tryptophan synthase alpha chain
MPFSDPLADGPIIQKSSMIALRNGVTLPIVLDTVAEVRRRVQLPLVLMGYLNPVLHFGPARFFSEAAQRGVDGVIFPELPLEEAGRFAEDIGENGLAQIQLVTPMTPEPRICTLDNLSSGFLYCVSTTGVTGGENIGPVTDYVRKVKRVATKNAVLVGFGISSPRAAMASARDADGVIVGSALLKKLSEGMSLIEIQKLTREFKDAISPGLSESTK